MCFDQSNPPSFTPLQFLPYPHTTLHSQLHGLFFKGTESLDALCMYMDVGPSTEAWLASQKPHP